MSDTTTTSRADRLMQPSQSLTTRCSWCGQYDRCVPVLIDREPTGLQRCSDPRCRHRALYEYVTHTGAYSCRKDG